MIVNRAIMPIKIGKQEEFFDLMRKVKPWYDERNVTTRFYTAYFGPYDVVVFEYETETLGDMQKLDQEWWADPLSQSLHPKYEELALRGRVHEAWVRHDL